VSFRQTEPNSFTSSCTGETRNVRYETLETSFASPSIQIVATRSHSAHSSTCTLYGENLHAYAVQHRLSLLASIISVSAFSRIALRRHSRGKRSRSHRERAHMVREMHDGRRACVRISSRRYDLFRTRSFFACRVRVVFISRCSAHGSAIHSRFPGSDCGSHPAAGFACSMGHPALYAPAP